MTIDWSTHDGTPESTCTCHCIFGRLKDGDDVPTFRSHAKFVSGPDTAGIVSRKPCPDCGRTDNLRSVSSDRHAG